MTKNTSSKKAKAVKAKKAPKEFNLFTFVNNVLRRSSKRTPAYNKALNAAKYEYFEPSKHGSDMRRVHFKCAVCGRFFKNRKGSKEIAVDHKDPVISAENGFESYDILIDRMFNGELQILCNYKGERDGVKSCHKIKTKEESAVRALTRKRLKAEGKSTKTKDR